MFYSSFDMDCLRCGSSCYIKSGKIKGQQRYECKQREYHYTVERRSNERPLETRQLALDLYLEGLGFRVIGRFLNMSNTAVLGWVKKGIVKIAQGQVRRHIR